jgi:hypothetical protein
MSFYSKTSSEFIRYSIFFFAVCLFISRLLWFGMDDTLPKIPIIGEATYNHTYFYFDNLYCLISILVVIYGVWSRDNKHSLIIGIVLFSICLALDVKRCNALFYFFLCSWSLYWFSLRYKIEFKTIYLLHIAALYIWSGIHKIHPFYFENSHQFLMNILDVTKPIAENKFSSDLSPYFEAGCGLLLVFNRTRRLAVILLIAMHLLIIATLCKLGWNLMVIPWNLFMILGMVSVFNFKVNFKEVWSKYNVLIKLFLILTSLVLPSLFLVDKINATFAYTMYSGRNIVGTLVIDSSDIPKLRSPNKDKLEPYYESLVTLDINYLSPDVNQAPFNYSEFVFKRIFHAVTKDFNRESTALILTTYPLGSDTAIYEYVYMKK